MWIIERELKDSTRPIITNIPVEVLPWVNGKGEPQLGLHAYLMFKHDKAYADKACARVYRVADDQIAEFFCWRVVGVNGRRRFVRVHVERHHKKGDAGWEERGPIKEFSTRAHGRGGHLYVIDEAWKFWGVRDWKDTGQGVLFYSAQHRHFGDDVFFVTQNTKQVETALHRVTQEYWVVTNRGMLRVKWFRQPDDFVVRVFDAQESKEPMHKWGFKLDRKGLAQTYDTSAGVGLSGRMAADVGRKRKGVSFRWLIVGACLVPVLFWFGISKGLAMASHRLMGAVKPGAAVPGSVPVTNGASWEKSVVNVVTGGRLDGSRHSEARSGTVKSVVDPGGLGSLVDTNVTLTGRAFVGGQWQVLTSDGEIIGPNEGLQSVFPGGAIISGRVVKWAKRKTELAPVLVVPAPRPYPVPGPFSPETRHKLSPIVDGL